MEEYISHVDYKKMMENFKKGTPKKMLKEGLEKEGNAFTAGLAKAKKGEKFKVGDKAVKDTSNYDASMEEEMHSFDGIKKDTPHAHKLKVNAPNLTGTIFKNEDGTYVFYDVDNHNADPSLPPFKTITDLMKHFGIKMQDLHENMEEASYTDNYEGSWGYREGKVKESHEGNDQWYDTFSDTLAQLNISDKARKLVDRALNHADVTTTYSDMTPQDAAKEFVKDIVATFKDKSKEEEMYKDTDPDLADFDGTYGDSEPDTDADYEEPRDDFDMAGDFNDGEFWENEVKKLQEIAGVGPQDDGPEDDNDEERKKRADKEEEEDTEAENAERDAVDEEEESKPNMHDPETVAKVVVKKYGAELKPKFDKYQASYEQYIQDIRSGKPNQQELSKAHNAIVKDFQNDVISWGGHEMLEAGMKRVEVSNLLSGYGYFEDWLMDYVSAINKNLKGVSEGLHMPPLQATGQTIVTNEDQAPYGFSVLSPDERKQLKEFIDSYKTIKAEISKLLEKAGKSGKIMEGREEDEAVPAARPAHYNEPTKTPKHNPSNLGGNRTGLE